ncbi:hypothetical protein D3C78_1338390 [compost metagenome]
MRRKVTCRDAGDGSGDVILELPEELLQAASLAVGDTLELERDPSDSASIRLKKVVLCDVCDASTVETGHGVLQAQWHDGEVEGMHLCRACFGYAMSRRRP